MAFIARPVPASFERELTASIAEFERDLRKAWRDDVEAVAPGHFRLHAGTTRLDILVEAGGIRRLGAFDLPILRARYHFIGGTEADRYHLLAPLDRAMQRGGG